MVRVKDLILVACLMVAATVTTAEVELWRLVPNQKSNFSLLPRVYLEGLSAQDLVREDARAVSQCAQSCPRRSARWRRAALSDP
jgi:hypothetical protein